MSVTTYIIQYQTLIIKMASATYTKALLSCDLPF